jgi:mannose-6-phosphate isomerase-like protein (cupin superfamily)
MFNLCSKERSDEGQKCRAGDLALHVRSIIMALKVSRKNLLWVTVPALLILAGLSGADLSRAYAETLKASDRAFAEMPVRGVRIIRPGAYPLRPAFYLSSNLYTTLATERETQNRFVSFDFQVSPGGGPLPHTHRNEWETFFVDRGEVTFTIDVDPNPPFPFIEQVIPAGTLVYGPQGPVHGFQNKTGRFARIFSFALPGGLHNFFLVAGTIVRNYFAPIPQIDLAEIVRTAFWAEQRGDALHFPGAPPPVVPPSTPEHVISTIAGKDLVTGGDRPRFRGPFGEERVSLLTPEEAGNITGATAFCGPGAPGRPGGTVDYSYFSLPPGNPNFPAQVTSENPFEVFYVLGGGLSFQFNDLIVTLPRLSYVEIRGGVPFSIANRGTLPARSLAISVIAPDCQ